MMRKLREQVTYANVMATIAVGIALGGTSYAALSLPHNSVGSRELQASAVRGREVKNSSLGVKELSLSARRSLRGDVGAIGPTGPQGPPGVTLFAIVNAEGTPVVGNATRGGSTGTAGSYLVGFSRSAAGCAATATLGTSEASTTVAGRITVSVADGQVGVHTYAPDGSPANLPFHLIVAC